MNKDRFAEKWHEMKHKVREKWEKLTDNDIEQINGKWEKLVSKLQQRYGYAKEQAERECNHWCESCEAKGGFHQKYSEREMEEDSEMNEGWEKWEHPSSRNESRSGEPREDQSRRQGYSREQDQKNKENRWKDEKKRKTG